MSTHFMLMLHHMVHHHLQIMPWLALQPNLQYIINPNMDPTIKNAWVLGLRTEIEF
ncbi:MAG: carbohydrate porin [Methylophilaceae bacterium]